MLKTPLHTDRSRDERRIWPPISASSSRNGCLKSPAKSTVIPTTDTLLFRKSCRVVYNMYIPFISFQTINWLLECLGSVTPVWNITRNGVSKWLKLSSRLKSEYAVFPPCNIRQCPRKPQQLQCFCLSWHLQVTGYANPFCLSLLVRVERKCVLTSNHC